MTLRRKRKKKKEWKALQNSSIQIRVQFKKRQICKKYSVIQSNYTVIFQLRKFLVLIFYSVN